jgi:hypothetical protein
MEYNKAFTAFLGLWSALMALIAPIQLLLLIIILSVLFDLVTGYFSGISKNKIKGFKNAIHYFNSSKATRSIVKMILYLSFTILIYAFEIALIGNTIYIVKFTTFLIVFVELKSICENMDILTGRDVFTSMFTKIRKLFENKVSNSITDKKTE